MVAALVGASCLAWLGRLSYRKGRFLFQFEKDVTHNFLHIWKLQHTLKKQATCDFNWMFDLWVEKKKAIIECTFKGDEDILKAKAVSGDEMMMAGGRIQYLIKLFPTFESFFCFFFNGNFWKMFSEQNFLPPSKRTRVRFTYKKSWSPWLLHEDMTSPYWILNFPKKKVLNASISKPKLLRCT